MSHRKEVMCTHFEEKFATLFISSTKDASTSLNVVTLWCVPLRTTPSARSFLILYFDSSRNLIIITITINRRKEEEENMVHLLTRRKAIRSPTILFFTCLGLIPTRRYMGQNWWNLRLKEKACISFERIRWTHLTHSSYNLFGVIAASVRKMIDYSLSSIVLVSIRRSNASGALAMLMFARDDVEEISDLFFLRQIVYQYE